MRARLTTCVSSSTLSGKGGILLRFAANLSFLYPEHSFPERFQAAAADGFTGVEYLFPYDWPAVELADLLRQYSLQQVLFNASPGDWSAGERGIACLPGRQEEFRESIVRACEYAVKLQCRQVHVMAGLAPPDVEREELWQVYRNNLTWAAKETEKIGVTILIEPINARDMPGYFLSRQEDAHTLVAQVGAANLKVQMDLYHCQIAEGDVTMKLRRYLGGSNNLVGHLQIASVPERHEPDEGELNYEYLFQVLEDLGYDGWIGCEYRPRAGTSKGLSWLQRYQSLQR